MNINKNDIGRTVYSKEYGKGVIFAFISGGDYPCRVGFESGEYRTYITAGKVRADSENNCNKTISFEPIKEKQKYWLWACEGAIFRVTDFFYSEKGYQTDGGSNELVKEQIENGTAIKLIHTEIKV